MIFGQNETNLGSTVVAASEGYESSYGVGMAQLESVINEGKMFVNLIGRDIKEATLLREGVDATEFVAEGAAEIKNSVVTILKKAWSKIAGIFSKFIAKLNGVVMRDTKALFKKYQKEWVSNASKKIKKWKFRKVKQFDKGLNTLDAAENRVAAVTRIKGDAGTDTVSDTLLDEMKDGTFLESLLSGCTGGNTDKKSFAKDMMDKWFDDEDTNNDEAIPSDIRTEVQKVLNDNKLVSSVTKDKSKIDKFFSNLIKECDKNIKASVDDQLKDNSTEGYAQNKIKNNNYKKDAIQAGITCSNMFTSVYLSATKMHVAQCRRIFMQVVAGSHVKEETLIDAIGESAEYEVYSSFEDFE